MSKTDLQFVAQGEARRAESDDHERRIARLETHCRELMLALMKLESAFYSVKEVVDRNIE